MLDNWWEELPGTGNSSHVVVVGGGCYPMNGALRSFHTINKNLLFYKA